MSFNEDPPPPSDTVKASNIRVCVRIRPIISTDVPSPVQKRSSGIPARTIPSPASDLLSVTEDSNSVVSRLTSQASFAISPSAAWKIHPDQATLSPSNPSTNNSLNSSYTVDAAFGPNSTTHDIYDSCVKDLVRSAVLEGYHASILAYGQTNAGKTFTMLGNTSPTKQSGKNSSSPTPTGMASSDGIVQLAVQHVFRCMHEKSFRDGGSYDAREYLLRVTFIEIYNESIHDLLAPSSSSSTVSAAPQNLSTSGIRIFENKAEGVIIRGLHEEIATTPEQVIDLLHRGQKHRQVAATGMNQNSSRSHSVFRLVIESSNAIRKNVLKNNTVRISSLSLVDLAGSECAKQAMSLPAAQNMSTDVRQREGQYINKSLLTLGHVIYKLSEMNNRTGGGTGVEDGSNMQASNSVNTAHIPYRDSKLTRILQPSLSGNAQICIICLISPLLKNIEESHNTLKFACRAKRIRQYATVNEVIDDKSLPTLLQNYRDEINELKEQLRQAKEAQLVMQRQQSQNQQSPSNKTIESSLLKQNDVDGRGDVDFLDMQDAETVEEDEIQVLVQAIHNLEDLIIKTSSNQQNQSRDSSPDRQVIFDGMESVISSHNNFGFETPLKVTSPNPGDDDLPISSFIGNEDDSFDSTMVITQANAKKSSHLIPGDKQDQRGVSDSRSSLRPSIQKMNSHDDESLSSRDEDNSTIHSNLIDELHRIQELLGTILRRKEMNSSSSKQSVRSAARPLTPERYSRNSSSYRDEEVSRLRSQLEEQTLAGSMRKADLSFLEFQLQQKDALLVDISGILESVEARQRQLEKENVRLKKELGQVKDALKLKESEMEELI